MRLPRSDAIVPEQERDEILETDSGCREMNPGIKPEMQMGIGNARFLRMPMIGKDFGVFSRSGENAIAVFLSSRFELTSQIRMGHDAKSLGHGEIVFSAVSCSDEGVRFVIKLEELFRLLEGGYVLGANAGESFLEEAYKIICGLSWSFSGHACASGEVPGWPIR